MLFIAISLTLGMGIGIFSAYHTKASLGGLFATLVVTGIVIRPVVLLGATASGTLGSRNPFLVYWMGFTSLPYLFQIAVYLFPIFIIMGRLGTWIYMTCIYVEIIETEDEKRARLLSEFGWEDIRKGKLGPQSQHAPSVKRSNRATSFGKRI
ncbi:MAG: hypothetical protein ABJ275_04435 [Maricaulaceae bacterium]